MYTLSCILTWVKKEAAHCCLKLSNCPWISEVDEETESEDEEAEDREEAESIEGESEYSFHDIY